MDLSIISLLFLGAAIAIGFIMKRNIGFIAIALALILGKLGGLSDNEIISGFNANLFMVLLGVSYLFTIADSNGTLEILARKMVSLARGHINLIPIVLVVMGAILAMVGPGTIATLALMVMISTALAKELNVDPLTYTVCSFMGAGGGGMSPIAPTGIVAMEMATQQGYTGIAIPYMLTVLLAAILFGTVYYFATGIFKLKAEYVPQVLRDVQPFNRRQWITLAGIAVMILLVMIFHINVGLASFFVATILNLIGVCDEHKVFSKISWSTLILICGVGVLMNEIIILGGIDKLSVGLASVMTPYTASPLMTLTGGIMGWFASTAGVVIPTLVPTVPGIVASLGDTVTPLSLISGLSIGSQLAGISPGSTGGAFALATYVALFKPNTAEKNRYFVRLFVTSIFAVLFVFALGFTGFYTWIQ